MERVEIVSSGDAPNKPLNEEQLKGANRSYFVELTKARLNRSVPLFGGLVNLMFGRFIAEGTLAKYVKHIEVERQKGNNVQVVGVRRVT